ncbi:hypothetical protein CEXT_669301 [Caerostris extrusa]|uniref:Uncharacterized protein n=1 Tax=Caerostris extrusa TaxID=172846 RepID=A0AAV4RP56_CAEEX|nr:hypothetical protein CEXT_669301 [Caerostris extrusa]
MEAASFCAPTAPPIAPRAPGRIRSYCPITPTPYSSSRSSAEDDGHKFFLPRSDQFSEMVRVLATLEDFFSLSLSLSLSVLHMSLEAYRYGIGQDLVETFAQKIVFRQHNQL